MKKTLISLLLALTLALVACSSNNNAENSDDELPKEITYGTTSDAAGLSPIDTNDSVSSNVTAQVFETLFIQNPETMEPEPLLAESYETPDDNTWVFKLNEGIEFHDGTPFNAEAVKYSFEELMDPDRAAPRASLLAPVESIEVEDEYTVILKTSKPYGPMLAALSHTNAAIVSPEADENQDINKEPVGTGPFVFDEWSEGDHITLSKNENYWRDPAKLDKVTFKVVPETSTAISMLETGEIQFIDKIPSDLLSRVKSSDNVEFDQGEGTRVSFLGFNMDKEPFNEKEFREAIAYAIDTEEYVEQLHGLGISNDSYMGPKIFGYDEDAADKGIKQDVEKAKEILKENNYENEEITLLAANRDNYMKMAEIVQAQLQDVGLKVKIESMEWGTFLEAARKGNFEMTFLGWANSTADGSELFYPNLHSNNIDASNYARYSDKKFDEIVEKSRETVDQDERVSILQEANDYVMGEMPWLIMEHGVTTVAYDKSIKGLEVSPNEQWYLYEVDREK